jgi:hypothetical protein
MRLEVCRTTDVDRYIAAHHYLRSVPAGARLRLWIKSDDGSIIGAMMWGRPTARTYSPTRIMELTRLFLVDGIGHCAESRALGMARRHIRKHFPEVKGLIAYTSSAQGHKGTIYEADGWFAVGRTRARPWNRAGRKNIDVSYKTRWVRSV